MSSTIETALERKPSLWARIREHARFKRKYLSIPYALFLILFVFIPLALIVYYAFSDSTGALSLDALVSFFTSSNKWSVLFVSLFMGIQTTLICLLLGYPAAYILANKKWNSNAVIVVLFVMPMWINFVIRTGATRDLLDAIGLSGAEYPWVATLIGMVYNYLPFTILPLYTTMLKLDRSQMEAASDLGANPFRVFIHNLLPQSMPGIISASEMVFMPVMSSYVISDTLSEGKITLFGNYIYLDFTNSMWNDGSFMALIMLLIVGVSMLFTRNFERDDAGARGGGLW